MKWRLLAVVLIAALGVVGCECGEIPPNYPHMKLEFRVDPDCVVEVTPYADWANGRLGARTFEKAAYLKEDKYAPGGLKYEPVAMELPGGIDYYIEVWCPPDASELGEGIVTSADFHVKGYKDGGYSQIWPPFQNQAPGVLDGFYVDNAK